MAGWLVLLRGYKMRVGWFVVAAVVFRLELRMGGYIWLMLAMMVVVGDKGVGYVVLSSTSKIKRWVWVDWKLTCV